MIAPQLYDKQDKAYIYKHPITYKKLWVGGESIVDITWNRHLMIEIIKFCHDTLNYDYNKIFLTFECRGFYTALHFSDVKDSYSGDDIGSDQDIKANITDLIDFFTTCTHNGTSSGQPLAGIIGWGATVTVNGKSQNDINKEVSNLFYK